MKKTHLHILLSLCLLALPLHADNSEPNPEEIPLELASQNLEPVEATPPVTTPAVEDQTPQENQQEKYVGKAAQEGSTQGAHNDWGKYVVAATVVGAAITAIVLVANNK